MSNAATSADSSYGADPEFTDALDLSDRTEVWHTGFCTEDGFHQRLIIDAEYRVRDAIEGRITFRNIRTVITQSILSVIVVRVLLPVAGWGSSSLSSTGRGLFGNVELEYSYFLIR